MTHIPDDFLSQQSLPRAFSLPVLPPLVEWIISHHVGAPSELRLYAMELYRLIQAKWPQLNYHTQLAHLNPDYQRGDHLYFDQVLNRPPHDLPGFKAALWRLCGKWLRQPRWIARGQGVPFVTASRSILIESFWLEQHFFETDVTLHLRAAYDPCSDMLYVEDY